MAYSRFSYSDIYIYPNVFGDITCSACMLFDQSIDLSTDQEIISHIKDHRDKRHNIPEGLEEEILADPERFNKHES